MNDNRAESGEVKLMVYLEQIAADLIEHADNPELVRAKAEELRTVIKAGCEIIGFLGSAIAGYQAAEKLVESKKNGGETETMH